MIKGVNDLKKLRQFLKFDFDSFSKEKLFIVTGCREWKDEVKGILGTKVDTVIIKDETIYNGTDAKQLNRFEKITFKVAKSVSVPENAYVVPINAKATVWGDYSDKLSVTCDDIRILQNTKNHVQA